MSLRRKTKKLFALFALTICGLVGSSLYGIQLLAHSYFETSIRARNKLEAATRLEGASTKMLLEIMSLGAYRLESETSHDDAEENEFRESSQQYQASLDMLLAQNPDPTEQQVIQELIPAERRIVELGDRLIHHRGRITNHEFSEIKEEVEDLEKKIDSLTRSLHEDVLEDFQMLEQRNSRTEKSLYGFLALALLASVLFMIFVYRQALESLRRQHEQSLRLRSANREMRKAKNSAEEGAAAKARFLANMSHEIRTPMNGILGMANLMMGQIKDRENAERLRIILNCGNSLLDIINDVLDFSKLEVGKVELENEPYGLEATIREVIDLYSSRASEKGLLLAFHPEGSLPPVIMGDATRFRQILSNLVNNAIKFTPKGAVTVVASGKLLPDARWEIEISVHDTGVGIPVQVQAQLFRPFSQVDASTTRRFGGTGLGLAISQELCEKMGGRMWFESRVGKGSEFIFTLVVSEAEIGSVSTRSSGAAEMDGDLGRRSPLHILVVEDNRTNQLVIKGLLAKLGYESDLASHGAEALLRLEHRSYDLVFMDSHMPVMDGFECTRQIISRWGDRRPRIISLSASTLKEDVERCLAAGMDDFLSKPLVLTALVRVLRETSAGLSSRPGSRSSDLDPSSDAPKVSEKQTEVSPQNPAFNERALRANLGGADYLIPDLIQTLEDTLPGQLEALESALKRGDAESVYRIAHTIKGAVSNFMAEPARSCAEEIEHLARDGELEGLSGRIQELRQRSAELLTALSPLRHAGARAA